MNCKQFRKLISFWIDGILDEQERKDFIHHMENCEQCRMELNEYKDMVSLMQGIKEVELPEGLRERLFTKLEEEIGQNGHLPVTKFMKSKRWIGIAAAIIVLLFSIRFFDNLIFMGTERPEDYIMKESAVENSEGSSSLSIASISDDEEDTTVSGEEKFEEKIQIQMKEEADSYDSAVDVLEDSTANNIVDSDDILDNNISNSNTSNNDISDIDASVNSIGDNNITEDIDTSKQEVDGSTSDNDTLHDDISDDILVDTENDENDTETESEFNDKTENRYGIMQFAVQHTSAAIETDLVKVKVQDVCITPSTLKMMAINNGIKVIKSTEDSVVLELTGLAERQILYQELSRIGEIEDAGEKTDSNQITVIIVKEE